MGSGTIIAVANYQRTYGLEVTGTITDELLLALEIAPPEATEVAYASTKAFLDKLDAEYFTYTLRGVDDDNDERVSLTIEGEETSYGFIYFFNNDLQHTNIRVWYLIEFDPADLLNVVQACNELNYNYNYARFYVDESDNTVTVSMDLIYKLEDAGEVVWEATRRMTNIINEAYPTLSKFKVEQ